MPLNKTLTIVNTTHEVGTPRSLIIEGSEGTPSVTVNKLSSTC